MGALESVTSKRLLITGSEFLSHTGQSKDCIHVPIDVSIYDIHTDGERDQAQVDACGRGRGQLQVDVHTENYIPLTTSCLLLMQRSWRFLPEFRFWME